MSDDELVIRSRRVATARGVAPAAIRIRSGRVHRVGDWHDVAGGELVDAGDSVVMPGLVDTHVHVNEPGRTEWEGFHTATRAAAAGGVTTILDMPLNCIPATTTADALLAKRAAAENQCWVDVGTIGGVIPGNDGELAGLHEGGVLAFKCFLVPSGVDEFPAVSEGDLRRALPVLDTLEATLMVHAELPAPIERAAAALEGEANTRAYSRYLASRPPEAEMQAIELVIRLCERFGVRMHIVHLSCADALPLLRTVRARGLRLSVETCPHYLTFAAEDVADGATELKCAPPIRERTNRDRLWSALRSGDIDMVVSDHSPCPPAMKRREDGDFLRAWGGIASLQLGLSAVWRGARDRGLGFDRIVHWMCEGPAELAGLRARKGRLDAGCDADLVIWNPESDFEVRADTLYDRHHVSPYIGMCLPGVVEATYLRGRCVYERGTFIGEPYGQLLQRDEGWRTSPT